MKNEDEGRGVVMRDVDDILREDARKQEITQRAISAADRIICEGCDGDNAQLLVFTAEVAKAFAEKVRIMAQSTITMRDILKDAGR